MKNGRFLPVLTLLFFPAPIVAADADAGWQAGVATANITPTQSMWMSGHNSSEFFHYGFGIL